MGELGFVLKLIENLGTRKKEQHADRETRVESLIRKTSLVLPGGTPSYHESNEGNVQFTSQLIN
jgi:hypothetical protein